MRYTINGAPPTSTIGTLISASSGTVTVTPSPLGATLRVIAYKAGMIDSEVHEAVFYYENESGNMPNPGDGGPGGGGILIDVGGQPTISYDANGNLIHYKEWNYRYDAQNRLIEAWNGTTTAEFYYDGKNRQIARNINGVIRFNSWDGWELLEEYGSGLTVTKGYLQGATGVIKSWDPIYGQLYYYQDKLGSTTHVANAIGQLVESFHYDLTGTPTETSTHGVVDLYAGECWIPDLRLYDLRNRFMSPELGRFLQPDPIGFKGDASNLYRYCGNDPVDRSDPLGLDAEENAGANTNHRYSYYLQPQLKMDSLNGWAVAHMTGPASAKPYQCAATAAILAGTWRSDGLHRVPEASSWLRGPDVTKTAPRVGALVAKGWDKDGHYSNKSNFDKDYRGNHAGLFKGYVDKSHKEMYIVDQYVTTKDGMGYMPIGVSKVPTEGFSRVDGSQPYQDRPLRDHVLRPPEPQDPGTKSKK